MDRFNYIYTNQFENIEIEWNGHASVFKINKEGQDSQLFESKAAMDLFNAQNSRFKGIQVVFHAKSEHTIEGEQFDLEMQIYHLMEHEHN